MTARYDFEHLLVTEEGPVRTVTLNRPDQLNAVGSQMHRELGEVWGRLRRDPHARVVVLTGAGRGFCSGGDMAMTKAAIEDEQARLETVEEARRIVLEMTDFPLPVVAAVNGPAVGLGCSLALFSDVVVMSEKAFFSDPHITVGLVAADGGVIAWPLVTSLLWAKEFLLTGDRIPAERALQMGMANYVVPAGDLLGTAYRVAGRIAVQPRQAVQDTKRALNIHLSRAVAAVINFAFASETYSFTQPDVAATVEEFAKLAAAKR